MKWKLVHKDSGSILKQRFDTEDSATEHLMAMGPAFAGLYEAEPDTQNKWLRKILTEGLVQGDLRRILIPQVSIDEYVPSDSSSDNVVVAFFVKGVDEAIIPTRDFIMKCKGVIDTAYGDSDTIADTTIIYAEFPRKGSLENIATMIKMVAMLAGLETGDFSMLIPTKQGRIPYLEEELEEYFIKRSERKNWEAQKKALGKDEPDESSDDIPDEVTEMFNRF